MCRPFPREKPSEYHLTSRWSGRESAREFILESTISSSNAIAAVPVVDNLSVDEIVDKVVGYSSAENISNRVEILRCLQKDLVTGQPLEVMDATECSRGQTNFILIDRNNLLSTAFDELRSFEDYCVTLEVHVFMMR